jgi:hypothetical protein
MILNLSVPAPFQAAKNCDVEYGYSTRIGIILQIQ